MAARLYSRYYGREAFFPILDELDVLEGRRMTTHTKRESQFKSFPLHPFFHKHFFSAQHLLRNIGIHWGVSDARERNQDLERMINRVAVSHGDDSEKWPMIMAHEFVMGSFGARAGQNRLTGDWIIYAKHNGENYYLAVVDHCVEGRSNDRQLFDWLRMSCEWEFPFLFQR
jgi:hypothetical protein